MEDSLSMSEGSSGTVAWIQQKASIASVFTPDLKEKAKIKMAIAAKT